MIDLFYFYHMPVAVLGLGKSGLATCKALEMLHYFLGHGGGS